MIGDFKALLGKTITGIHVREDKQFHSAQVFLTFDDDTYYEIYADGLVNGLRQICPGDIHTIRKMPAGNRKVLVDVARETA